MIVCENCPYRGRCEQKQRCIQGKNEAPAPQVMPKPQNVNTTFGNALTGVLPKKSEKQAIKKTTNSTVKKAKAK